MTGAMGMTEATITGTGTGTSKQRIYYFNRPGSTGRFFYALQGINFFANVFFVN